MNLMQWSNGGYRHVTVGVASMCREREFSCELLGTVHILMHFGIKIKGID